MCGGGGGGYDSGDAARDREAARREAEAQRTAAENEAQLKANASTAMTRSRRRQTSLLAMGARQGVAAPQRKPTPTSSVLAMGATTLGGTQ